MYYFIIKPHVYPAGVAALLFLWSSNETGRGALFSVSVLHCVLNKMESVVVT
jgi:hypothetical protein